MAKRDEFFMQELAVNKEVNDNQDSDLTQPFNAVNVSSLGSNSIDLTYQSKREQELFKAVYERNYQRVIEILVKDNVIVNTREIDIETGGYNGLTPVDVALLNNDYEMCKILIVYGADFKNLSEYAAMILNKALIDNDKETVYNILDWYKFAEHHNIVQVGDNSDLPEEIEF